MLYRLFPRPTGVAKTRSKRGERSYRAKRPCPTAIPPVSAPSPSGAVLRARSAPSPQGAAVRGKKRPKPARCCRKGQEGASWDQEAAFYGQTLLAKSVFVNCNRLTFQFCGKGAASSAPTAPLYLRILRFGLGLILYCPKKTHILNSPTKYGQEATMPDRCVLWSRSGITECSRLFRMTSDDQ